MDAEKKEVETLSEFVDVVKAGVESMGTTFDSPDDDWLPAFMHLQMTDGHDVLYIDMPSDVKGKDRMFAQLYMMLRFKKPIRYAMVMNGYGILMANIPGETEEEKIENVAAAATEWTDRFSEHPQSVEQITIDAVDCNGEIQSWIAEIKRSEDAPPTLGEWQQIKMPNTSGRIAGLRKAMQ